MTRKRKPYTKQWYKDAINEALLYAPKVYPCAECHNPVIDGHCCTSCGSDVPEINNPFYNEDQNELYA